MKRLHLLLPLLVSSAMVDMAQAQAQLQPVPAMAREDFDKATGIYFNRCGGCHGSLRKGATGKPLTPDKTRTKTIESLAKIIYSGTDAGMPGWGTAGVLSKDDADLMAKFVQNEPVAPPEFNMKDIQATWKVHVPPEKRPTKPMHKRNIDTLFAVILRDAGKIAIIDGDTKEIWTTVDSGFAVHTLRYSHSGRYLYTIGRDAKATLVDLWMDPPQTVAEVKTGIEARSIDSSKYKGPKGDFLDKLAVVGNYWPPSYVILDGQTLEPKKVVGTRGYTYDTNEYHPEPRVAAIVASHYDPEWILTVKETGQLLLVDYSDLKNFKVTSIEAERFLHDGGFDASKRYFLVAANMRDKMVAIDIKTKKLVGIVETGNKPHPGRGANFVDPQHGPVYATPHLGEPLVALIGTDAGGKHKANAWKVVRKLVPAGEGGLFLKTHPKSNHLWVDHALAKDENIYRSVSVFDIKNPDAPPKIIKVGD
ncbi:MAG: cytochrome D1 domain-containing protein, partial [Rhodocyclaceae bacterium]|nr:cytochrome D1 domain-containing protein [Rhodocyclaceae bacterium]